MLIEARGWTKFHSVRKLAFSPGGFRRYRGCRLMITAGITNPRNDRTGSVRQRNASRALKTQSDARHDGHSQNGRVERGFWSRGHFYEQDLLWDLNNEGWEDTCAIRTKWPSLCPLPPPLFFEESMKVVFKHLTQSGASKCNIISCLSCLSGSAVLQLSTETLPESLHIWFPLRCFCFFFLLFHQCRRKQIKCSVTE